jgi:hypothetical protein
MTEAQGIVVRRADTPPANREVNGVLLPSRQVTVCQASAGSSRASVEVQK